MNIKDAKKLVTKMLELAINEDVYFTTRFISGPGLGKSSIVKQAAEEVAKALGVKVGCKVVRLCEVEQPDVKGYGLPPKGNVSESPMEFSLPFWAWDKERDGQYGILFLDEQPQANDDVNKVAAEIMLDRRVGNYQLPKGVIVVAAGNRESDRSGARKTMAFIQNRIMDINIDPHKDSLVQYMEDTGVHPAVISFTEAFPNIVLQDKVPDKPGPFCTPRSICALGRLVDTMPIEMFTECANGAIGEGAGAQFVSHLRVINELPKYSEIVANPTKCPVPTKPDASYATMRMITHNVDPDTAKAAFTYLGRMPKEFQTVGLRHAMRRCPAIVANKEFAGWLRDNKELLLAANVIK